MSELLYDLILQSARQWPAKEAVFHKNHSLSYEALAENLHYVAQGLLNLGLSANERAAVYLPKQVETVSSLFGTSLAGGVFVPVNPLLKPEQVEYILRDCNVRILVTSADRANLLSEVLANCHDLNHVIIVGPTPKGLPEIPGAEVLSWDELVSSSKSHRRPARIDTDMAAILYTSGSTGRPKGVVLSHRNMVAGAKSVAQYLENTPDDRLLAVLPFSFDYGLSQLTTAFNVGASVFDGLHVDHAADLFQVGWRWIKVAGGPHGLPATTRCYPSRGQTPRYRSCRRATPVGTDCQPALARGGTGIAALYHQFWWRYAQRHPECLENGIAQHTSDTHVWSHRGLSFHLSANGRTGSSPRFHGTRHTQCRGHGGA